MKSKRFIIYRRTNHGNTENTLLHTLVGTWYTIYQEKPGKI